MEKLILEQKDAIKQLGIFNIGHSNQEQKTYMPHAIRRQVNGVKNTFYIDTAGLQDTGDKLIDYVNFFVTKELFKRVNSIRFLFTINYE